MSQIRTLTERIGEGSREVVQSLSGDWEKAGAHSTKTNWSHLAILEAQCVEMEEQIEEMLEKFPQEAARSEIGIFVLQGYMRSGILEGSESDYPYRFTPEDLIKDGMCIQAQLVAEEYFENGVEACPLTPEAFLSWDFEKNRKKEKEWKDPFTTFERPNVTIDYASERFNFNPDLEVQTKPELKEWIPQKTQQI